MGLTYSEILPTIECNQGKAGFSPMLLPHVHKKLDPEVIAMYVLKYTSHSTLLALQYVFHLHLFILRITRFSPKCYGDHDNAFSWLLTEDVQYFWLGYTRENIN